MERKSRTGFFCYKKAPKGGKDEDKQKYGCTDEHRKLRTVEKQPETNSVGWFLLYTASCLTLLLHGA